MQHEGSPPDADGRAARSSVGATLRWCGTVLFSITAILPVYGCHANPKDFDPRPLQSNHVIWKQDGDQVPVLQIASEMEKGSKESGIVRGFWRARQWYPYLLAPLWIGALLAAAAPRSSISRGAGATLLAVSVAVAVFEAFYLAADYQGFTSGWFQPIETGLAWLVVCAVLFWRPRGVGLTDPAAAVSAQALLAVCHALTFPVFDGAAWLTEGFSPQAVFTTLTTNYRPGFWIALGALGLAAAPLYVPAVVRRRSEPARPAPAAPPAPQTVVEG